MRRLLIYLFSLFPLLLTAANTLSLSAVSGHPGDTLTVTATLTNTDAVSAAQVDIPLNKYLKYVNGSIILNSARSNGHSIYAAVDKDTLYVTLLSLSNNAIIGSSGELFSFRVVLGNEPATYNLTPQVTMAGTSAQSLAVNAAAGSVTLLSPKIQVVTTTLDYGHVPIRSTYNQTLLVSNVGNEPLHITGIEFSAIEFSIEQTVHTVAPGTTESMVISYAPTQRGAISETIRLRSDAVNDANVYGANVATLVADPFSVNELHVQPAAGISDDTVTITLSMNNMETDLMGVQVMFPLPEQLVFVEGSPTLLSRANGMSIASSIQNDTLSLFVYSLSNTPVLGTDGDLLTFRLRLNGSSGSYGLYPQNTAIVNQAGENLVSAVYSNYVTIQSPTISGNSSLDFGSIPVTRPDTVSYTLSNYGQVPLNVERTTFLMEGFRVISSLPVTIGSYSSTTLQVEYTPTKEGPVSTTMQVYSNDPACRMKSVDITAQVFEPNSMSLSGKQQADDSYLLSVEMDNYTAIPGVQFSITCPAGMTPGTFTLTERAQGLSVAMQPEGENSWIVLLYSLAGSAIATGDGPIGTFTFSASAAKAHTGETISLSNIVLSDSKGNNRNTGTDPQHTIWYRYVASFVDEDGTLLQRDTLDYNVTPVYRGAIPTKSATAQYTYTFSAWSPAIAPLTGNTTYTATYSATVNKYLVAFVDEGGAVLQSDSVEYGTTPSFRGTTPTKPATAQYTYTFAGWTPEVVSVTGNATYMATYSATVNQYVITFVDEDGTQLQRDTLDYGTMPAYRGENPTKEATAQYTYAFAGWSPVVVSVSGEATYSASYSSTVNRYVVIFQDEDSTLLQIDTLNYGTLPAYRGTTPTKDGNAQYSYPFLAWSPNVVSVTGDAVYTATYAQSVNKYVISFLNEDNTSLLVDTLEYGSVPSYRGTTPTKPATAQYTYIFKSWSPTITSVTESAIYVATYDSIVNKYVVIFQDEDSTLLQIDTLAYGTLPEYRGTTPAKAATAQYTFTFAGWDIPVVSVIGNAVYTATYTQTINQYVVTFLGESGELLQRDTLDYGSMPVYRGVEPRKTGTAEYHYVFTGWNPAITEVTGDVTYMAMFDSIVNTYIITFINDDNSILQIDTLEYGTMPIYRGAEPQKPSDGNYTYTFNGWQPEITAVVSDATYVATYKAIPISALPNVPETKQPVKIWRNGKMFILLPNGQVFDSTCKRVE